MSMVIDEEITCPRCGTKSIFYHWYSVTAWLDPDAARRAREGTLNQFTCKACGLKANVEADVLVSEEGKMTLYTPPTTEEA